MIDVDEESKPLLSSPPSPAPSSPRAASDQYRSIDLFFDEATASQKLFPWRYFVIILSIGTGNASFSTAILLISYLLADDEFNFTVMRANPEYWAGPLAAAVFAGMLPGGLLAGAICDSWVGRKPLLLLTLAANTITAIWTAFTHGPIEVLIVRFLAGLAVGATEPVLFALITELAPRKHRGLIVSFVASFWMAGNLVVASVGLVIFRYLEWSWRSYVLLCAIPAMLGLLMVLHFVPESPRYLAFVSRDYEGAVRSANYIAISLGVDASSQRLLQKEELMHQISAGPQENILVGKTSLAEVLAALYHSELRFGTTIPLQVIWLSLCFGSYTIVTWINTIYAQIHLDDMYWNLLLFALANLPGNLLSFYLLDKVGRIKTLVGSLVLSSASLAAFAWYSIPGHVSTAGVVATSCTFQALETVAWNVLDTATGELFPTSSRSSGIGLCTATGRLGAILAQFASGILIESPVKLLFCSSLCFLIPAIVPKLLRHGEMSQTQLSDRIGSASLEARR